MDRGILLIQKELIRIEKEEEMISLRQKHTARAN
jgi:hypothetical protein